MGRVERAGRKADLWWRAGRWLGLEGAAGGFILQGRQAGRRLLTGSAILKKRQRNTQRDRERERKETKPEDRKKGGGVNGLSIIIIIVYADGIVFGT